MICFEVAYDGLVRDVVTAAPSCSSCRPTTRRSAAATRPASSSRWAGCARSSTAGPVLVAATSGVSADHRPGRARCGRSDVFTADVLVQAVPVRAGSTLASRLGALPEWLLAAVSLAAAAAVATTGARRRRTTRLRQHEETE